MDKSSLKKALLEVKEIETFAAKSAKKLMEQEFLPKVEESVRKALLEMEEEEMKEASEISLDAGASVNVTVDSTGKVTIKSGDGTAPIVTEPVSVPNTTSTELPASPVDTISPIVPGLNSASEEVPMEEPMDISSGEDEMNPEEEIEEELFEIVDDSEETPVVDDESSEEVPMEEEPVENETEDGEDEFDLGDDSEEEAEESEDEFDLGDDSEEEAEESGEDERLDKIESDMEDMKGLLEKILEKVGQSEESEGDVEIVGDETEEGGEDEFDLDNDSEETEDSEDMSGFGEESTEEEEEPIADEEEEIMFEFDDVLDEKNQNEEEMELHELEKALKEVLGDEDEHHPLTVKDALAGEEEELFEIEIEGGEEMEESSSISLSNQHGQNLKPNTPHKKVRSGLSESDKAQNESKMDGLKKENESLKSELKEYKSSLIELRKQINEVQTFNAKLAYANKVFTKGGLTNEEKSIIAERFDSCKDADEAKALYNKLIKENTTGSKPNVNKIKLPQAASTNSSSDKGSLYENEETRRMKKLAGIIK